MADVELSALGAVIKSAYEAQTNTNAYTDDEQTKLAGISTGAEVNAVDTVNTQTGVVVLDADDISDAATTNKFVTASDITNLGNLSGTNTGDQTITLTGDVTGTGTGSFATTIANGAVTLAKQANIATARIMGRVTAATGVQEALTAAQVRTLINVADGATANAKASEAEVFTGTNDEKFVTPLQLKPKESIIVAVGDETTAATTGTAKVTFRMPYAFELSEVRASATTAPTGSVATFDINETGVTILSTKITIDATEKTSTTAVAAPVISDSTLADDAEMTIDIDGVGATVAGAGYKIYLIGNRT